MNNQDEMIDVVTVMRDGKPVRINKSDYDPEADELVGQPQPDGQLVDSGDGKPDPDPNTDPVPTAAEVLAMAADTNVHFSTFAKAAAQVLGEDCPGKKADILAALEAKAKEQA